MEDMKAIVLDAGSGMIKAGFAGQSRPFATFHSTVGKPKDPQVMVGIGAKSTFVGEEAINKRGLLHLTRPIEHGSVANWEDLERIFQHAFLNELRVSPEEHPCLLTESPFNPKRNRTKMVETMFENFNVPYLYICIQAFLSLFATGRTSGVVLDSGAGVTHAVPIWEGHALPNAISRLDSGGHDLTAYMMKIINESGLTLNSTAEFDICREIKEKFGYVAQNFDAEMEYARSSPAEVNKEYTLPDGQKILLTNEHFRCPEALFKPYAIGIEGNGIHEITYNSIMKAPVDVRMTLYSNVVLTGGSTCFRGLPDRFRTELKKLAPSTIEQSIQVIEPENRQILTWIGGSILASILNAHSQMWVSRDDYYEHGANIVYRKCY